MPSIISFHILSPQFCGKQCRLIMEWKVGLCAVLCFKMWPLKVYQISCYLISTVQDTGKVCIDPGKYSNNEWEWWATIKQTEQAEKKHTGQKTQLQKPSDLKTTSAEDWTSTWEKKHGCFMWTRCCVGEVSYSEFSFLEGKPLLGMCQGPSILGENQRADFWKLEHLNLNICGLLQTAIREMIPHEKIV